MRSKRKPSGLFARGGVRVVEPLERRTLLSVTPITLATVGVTAAPRVAVDAAGDVFGTTLRSGTSAGTIFEIPAGTNTVKTLASFGSADPSVNTLGIDPGDIVIDPSGNLFGGSRSGGVSIDGAPNPTGRGGTLWELPTGSAAIRVRQTYSHINDYYNPSYGVSSVAVDAADNVFAAVTYDDASFQLPIINEYVSATGETGSVIASNAAVLPNFAVDATGNTFTVSQAMPGDIGPDGIAQKWPTRTAGGVAGSTVPSPTTVATFDGTAATGGGVPEGVAVDAAGNLFVTTSTAVTKVPAGTSQVRVLASLPGANFMGNPVVDAAGDVFAVSSATGGPEGQGEVVELPAGASAMRVLTSFTAAGLNQQFPELGGLTVDGAGDLFGTRPSGTGTTTVFEYPAADLPTGGSALVPTMAKSRLPTAVFTGAVVKGAVAVTVTNGGTATSTGTDMVTLYAVPGASGSAVVPIAGVTRKLTLKASRSATVSIPVKGLSLPAGTYTIAARVTDAAGGTSASGGGATLAVADPHVVLSATMTAAPAAVLPGRPLTLTLRLTNGGNGDSTGLTTIAVYLSADGTAPTLPVTAVTRSVKVKTGGKAVIMRLKVKVPTTAVAGNFYPLVMLIQGTAKATAATNAPVAVS